MFTWSATRTTTYNFSDLLALMKDEPKEEKKEPFQFSVNNIVIENGSIDFVDSPFNTTHTVRETELRDPLRLQHPGLYRHLRAAAICRSRSMATRTLSKGKTKLFKDTRETIFNILIEDLDIPFYLAYIPHELNISVPSGKLDVQSTITFSMTPEPAPRHHCRRQRGAEGIRPCKTGRRTLSPG